MRKKVEVLVSIMNIKSEKEYKELLIKNRITGNVLAVNQVKKGEEKLNIKKGEKKIYTYQEKGVSRSRNRLLENASGDICIFADNDTVYVENYEKIVEEEYKKNPKADIIIFFAENENPNREKNKRIGNKKINFLDIMKIRTYEITIKKETIKKIKKEGIKFDLNFGPGGIFNKGEETVFMSEIYKRNFKIYSVDKKISNSKNYISTWFTEFNEQFLYDQGAIFYKIAPKWYNILIIQYMIRKYPLYKKNVKIKNAYKQMRLGAQKCKKIYERQENG